MSVQLYEGCWGVTRGGQKEGPTRTANAGDHEFVSTSGCYRADGRFGYGHEEGETWPTQFDIIAVFATEAEADAYLAGETASELPDELTLFSDGEGNLSSWLPQGDKHYAASKWRKVSSAETLPPTPKPVTWPDGVMEMAMEIGPTVMVCHGFIDTTGVDDVSFTAEQAIQLAALLLAAADEVEGRE